MLIALDIRGKNHIGLFIKQSAIMLLDGSQTTRSAHLQTLTGTDHQQKGLKLKYKKMIRYLTALVITEKFNISKTKLTYEDLVTTQLMSSQRGKAT